MLGETKVTVGATTWTATHVDMGNPHAVAFVDDEATLAGARPEPAAGARRVGLPRRGQRRARRPSRRAPVAMRVHERGSGETRSCGTGTGAALVATAMADGVPRPATYRVDVPGGTLTLTWTDRRPGAARPAPRWSWPGGRPPLSRWSSREAGHGRTCRDPRSTWTSREPLPSSPEARRASAPPLPARSPPRCARRGRRPQRREGGGGGERDRRDVRARRRHQHRPDPGGRRPGASWARCVRWSTRPASAGRSARSAATGRYDSAHDLDAFKRVVAINLVGTFDAVRIGRHGDEPQRARRRRRARRDRERSSVAAFDGQIGQAAYAASKGGLVGLTLPVARDLAASASGSTPWHPA